MPIPGSALCPSLGGGALAVGGGGVGGVGRGSGTVGTGGESYNRQRHSFLFYIDIGEKTSKSMAEVNICHRGQILYM